MHVEHLGGENCLTGSCHLVRAGGVKILVDCGLGQANEQAVQWWSGRFSTDIDYTFLTHAHVDRFSMPESTKRAAFYQE